jgi:peptidoglycan/LPS O-acetylase OafA/YrhL
LSAARGQADLISNGKSGTINDTPALLEFSLRLFIRRQHEKTSMNHVQTVSNKPPQCYLNRWKTSFEAPAAVRLEFLDVIRAILAWYVVAVHSLWFNGFFGRGDGQYAINGFIILSGFVITLLLVTKQESFGLFMVRRLLRIFPVYLVCLALALAVRPLAVGTAIMEAPRELSEEAFWWQHLVVHLGLLQGLVPEYWLPRASAAFLPTAWSISLELQLYLIAPVLILLLRRKVIWPIWRASLVVLVPQIHWRLHTYMSHMGAFLPQKFYLFLAGALLFTYAPWQRLNVPLPSAFRPAAWLGSISYSTYLVHYPLMALLNAILPPNDNGLARALILFLIATPLIILSSWFLCTYVEIPFIRLGRRIKK